MGGVEPPLSSNVWPSVLSESIEIMKSKHVKLQKHDIDHCLYFKFENGSVTTGGHSDLKFDTKEFDDVYFISLGAERTFTFINKKTSKELNVLLKEGMLMHITRECNRHYKHKRLFVYFSTNMKVYLFF